MKWAVVVNALPSVHEPEVITFETIECLGPCSPLIDEV